MFENYFTARALSDLIAQRNRRLVEEKADFLSKEVYLQLDFLTDISDTLLHFSGSTSESEKILRWYNEKASELTQNYNVEVANLLKSYSQKTAELIEQLKKELEKN